MIMKGTVSARRPARAAGSSARRGTWSSAPGSALLLSAQSVIGPGDVHVHLGCRGDEVEGVAVRHLVDRDLAGGGGRGGGGGAVGEHGLREGRGQDAGAGTRAAHGHPDDRRAGVAQQFQYREHVGGRLRGAHQLDHGAAVAQVAVGAEQVGRHRVEPVLGRDDLRRRAATPAGHEVEAVGLHVDVGAAVVVGGAQDSHPFGLRTFEPAALALRTAGEDERDRGLRHQLGDVEAAHQVQPDLGQADPGGEAVELAQAALGVLGSERGGDAVAVHAVLSVSGRPGRAARRRGWRCRR